MASADHHRKASHAAPRVQSQHPVRDHDTQLLCARPNAAGDWYGAQDHAAGPGLAGGSTPGPATPTAGGSQLATRVPQAPGRSQRKLRRPKPRSSHPTRMHSGAQRPPRHTELVCGGGLCAGFQGDHSDAVTVATVATVHCPSALPRKAAGCGRGDVGQENWESWI